MQNQILKNKIAQSQLGDSFVTPVNYSSTIFAGRRCYDQRGGRDSNPRSRLMPRQPLSRRSHSTTLAPPLYHFPTRLRQVFRRRERDSNPRWALTHNCFQDSRLRPLGHPSSVLGIPSGRKNSTTSGGDMQHANQKWGICYTCEIYFQPAVKAEYLL
jgi:hypothetical protein